MIDNKRIFDYYTEIDLGENIVKTFFGMELQNVIKSYIEHEMDPEKIEEKYLDFLALEYAKSHDNVYMLLLWPKGYHAHREDMISDIICANADIVYKKEFPITYSGLGYLMSQLYRKFPWVGNTENAYKGARGKAYECWHSCGRMLIYLVEASDAKTVTECKENIRTLLKDGRNTIHSTDNWEETIMAATILLNRNSLHMLNHGKPYKYKDLFYKVEDFKQKIIPYDSDDFIIDSSSVMGLYALRKTRDIDFITAYDRAEIDIDDAQIGNHEGYVRFYGMSKEELLYNPDNFIMFWGVKFITLEVLRRFKINRNEIPKDVRDVILIDKVLTDRCSVRLVWVKIQLATEKIMRQIKSMIKRILFRR